MVREVKRAGGIPMVGDSTGGMTAGQGTAKTFRVAGIAATAEESGAELVNFDISGVKAIETAGPITTLHIAKPVSKSAYRVCAAKNCVRSERSK